MTDLLKQIFEEERQRSHPGAPAQFPGAISDRPREPTAAAGPDAKRFFDEARYLRLHPDVATAIDGGEWDSGYEHYTEFGCLEGRSLGLLVEEPPSWSGAQTPAAMPAHHIDTVMISEGGGVFVVGWIDDSVVALDHVQVVGEGWRLQFDQAVLSRIRRQDVEHSLENDRRHLYGFWSFSFADRPLAAGVNCGLRIVMHNGAERTLEMPVRATGDEKMRETVLHYLADAKHLANPLLETIRGLDNLNGGQILKLNRAITKQVVASAYMERFGSPRKRYTGSIIVCLYKKAEYLFLQSALFSGGEGIEDYEFIYISNSPELTDQLLKEARIAQLAYGIDLSIVVLSGNAGFGAANNVAAKFASSDRLLFVNPDVLPLDQDWAAKHTRVVANLPPHQTVLFGVPLYYDDGSLMHGGMHFAVDVGLSVGTQGVVRRAMVRVEHYGKGAPPGASQFVTCRPVPAVTGAFISVDRAWFDRLGGFTEDYMLGHYEDADLCLKSILRGGVPWLHDIKLWHLEGKGSTRLPSHGAATTVNRWFFSKRWGEYVMDQLLGSTPPHPFFQGSGEAAAAEFYRRHSPPLALSTKNDAEPPAQAALEHAATEEPEAGLAGNRAEPPAQAALEHAATKEPEAGLAGNQAEPLAVIDDVRDHADSLSGAAVAQFVMVGSNESE